MARTSAIRDGHYARKQLFTRSWLINWSHSARFKMGVQLAQEFAGQQLLDYGSGDGTFIALLQSSPAGPQLAVGAELADDVVEDCRTRHGDPRLEFVRIDALDSPQYQARFDGLMCMEVLEHVVDRESVYALWKRLMKPRGRLIISVPVETGMALAIKQMMRKIAGWRGIGDYPGMSPYTWADFLRSLVAGRKQHMVRPIHVDGSGLPSHCHKGFNWRALQDELRNHFDVERTISSPLPWLPLGWGSQVWFLLRHKG